MIKPYFDEFNFTLYHGETLNTLKQFKNNIYNLIYVNPP